MQMPTINLLYLNEASIALLLYPLDSALTLTESHYHLFQVSTQVTGICIFLGQDKTRLRSSHRCMRQ